MANPIRAFGDYFGVRPKGRSLTPKERFKILSIKSLEMQVLPTAVKWAGYYTVVSAVADLFLGKDDRFSEILVKLGFLALIYSLAIIVLQAAGRKHKAANTY